MDRRSFIRSGLAATAGTAVASHAGTNAPAPIAARAEGDAPAPASVQAPAASAAPAPAAAPGRLRQSVCAWCFGGMPLADLCALARRTGIGSVELLDEPQWATVREHGLACAVANGPGGITRGWNRPANHDALVRRSEELLPKVAAAGIPQMIVFSGNRDGLPDADGLRHCADGLRRIMPAAERAGVTVVMELLNSKVDHRDYMCDRTAWGVELCKRVGSDRFRLLYDVYHMQVMEGDVIRTIREHHQWVAHYHVAGNPGRGNLDATQELQYPAICAAIADAGFGGWLAQEFIPRGDPAAALAEAVRACTA